MDFTKLNIHTMKDIREYLIESFPSLKFKGQLDFRIQIFSADDLIGFAEDWAEKVESERIKELKEEIIELECRQMEMPYGFTNTTQHENKGLLEDCRKKNLELGTELQKLRARIIWLEK